jgi:hypothetical protein
LENARRVMPHADWVREIISILRKDPCRLSNQIILNRSGFRNSNKNLFVKPIVF